MKLKDIGKLSTRMFKTNPARTWLTIMGMGVGTGAVVTLVGLGFGLQEIILEQIVFGEMLLSLTITTPAPGILPINDAAIDRLIAHDFIVDVAPVASFTALMTHGELTANVILESITPAYVRYSGMLMSHGEPFFDETEQEDRRKVLVAPSVLKLYGIEDPEEAVGETVSFRIFVPDRQQPGRTVEVPIEGTFEIKGVTGDDLALNVHILMSELSRHVAIEQYEEARVRALASEHLDEVEEYLLEEGFNVVALSKTIDQATKIFQGIQAVLAVFGGIALIVSAIGMFNTMTVTLLERTGEIGIMRTIGASSNDIKILFISEAVIVGFLGGIVGILMGVGVGFALNTLLNFMASQFGGTAMALFSYPIPFLLFIATFSAIVGFLTGVFPARRAASLNPLDAIRYK